MALVLISPSARRRGEAHGSGASPIWPSWLWAFSWRALAITAPVVYAPEGRRLLQPLTIVHPEWVGTRIDKLTAILSRFREHPSALCRLFQRSSPRAGTHGGVLPRGRLRVEDPVTASELAVIVPDFTRRADVAGVGQWSRPS
jgi:hypothetical protein